MSKVLIFSDLHIHPHKRSIDRLQNCLDALKWVFQTAVDQNIDTLLFAGDLFHDRQKIDVLTYQRTFEVFQKYFTNNKLKLYLLLGNHDLWHATKWDVSSVTPFSALPGVEIVDNPCVYEIKGKKIGFLPYTHNPIEDSKMLHGEILIAHVAIDDALWNVMYGIHADITIEHDGDMVKVGPEIFDKWKRVFLGHYHAEQKLNETVEYIGSPFQLSYGEAFQHKHIIVYDVDTDERQYVRNTFSPQHLIIPEKDLKKYNLNGNFVKVMVDDIGSAGVIDLQNDLLSKNNIASLEIKQIPKKSNRHEIENAKAILFNEDEMLEVYLKEVGIGDMNKELLIKIGKQIIKEAKDGQFTK